MNATAHWAITYHSNSHSPRARKWYRVTRIVETDGRWFEIYWHPDEQLRGNSLAEIRKKALTAGLKLLAGVYRSKPGIMNEMERVR